MAEREDEETMLEEQLDSRDDAVNAKEFDSMTEFALAAERSFDSKILCDAVIRAGKGKDQKLFKVCSTVLAWRCKYFHSCFFGSMTEAKTKELRKPNISSEIMRLILRYLYSGRIQISEHTAVPLLSAADEMGIDDLAALTLKHAQDCITVETVFTILRSALDFNHPTLVASARRFITEHAFDCIEQPGFLQVDLDSLVHIYSSDDLVLHEENVWLSTIKWGCHACRLSNDIKELETLTPENMEELKTVLQPLLPLFRIFLVKLDFISTEVDPRNLLPDSELKLAYKFLIQPASIAADHPWIQPRAIPSNHGLITPHQIVQVNQWIGTGQKKWVSLFEASKDGWTSSAFHQKCDNKGPTVVVCTDGKNICGGYAPVAWGTTNGYIKSPDSFVFSIVNPTGKGLTQFKNMNPPQGVYSNTSYGPTFGGGHDLYIADNANTSGSSFSELGNSFQGPLASNNFLFGQRNFTLKNYVVFQLV